MKNPKNTLALDLRCAEEGRCVVQLDIEFLTIGEREWLFKLLQDVQKGRQITFGVESTPTGEQVLRFTLAPPEAHNEPQIALATH
jgi:hypothetical protein